MEIAPKEADDETPKIYGSAKELRINVCIKYPESAKEAPIENDNKILGNRNCMIVMCL